MKPNYYKILSISLKWALIIAVGYFLARLTSEICQGPDRVLDAGHDYVVGDLPGHLYYWPHGKPLSMIGLLDEKVEGFLFRNKWIVGKTRNYWFAVDKKAHRVYYPLPFTPEKEKELQEFAEFINTKHIYYPIASDPNAAEKEIKKITGLDFSSSDLLTKFPPISIWWPSPYVYQFPTSILGIYVGAGYAIIVFLVIMVRRVLRHRRKLRANTSQGVI
jgi:hypothetical protein